MKMTDKKLGKIIKTAKRLYELSENNSTILYNPTLLGVSVAEIYMDQISFSDAMNCINSGQLFEEKVSKK